MKNFEINDNTNNVITIALFVIMFLCLVIFASDYWIFSFVVLFNVK